MNLQTFLNELHFPINKKKAGLLTRLWTPLYSIARLGASHFIMQTERKGLSYLTRPAHDDFLWSQNHRVEELLGTLKIYTVAAGLPLLGTNLEKRALISLSSLSQKAVPLFPSMAFGRPIAVNAYLTKPFSKTDLRARRTHQSNPHFNVLGPETKWSTLEVVRYFPFHYPYFCPFPQASPKRLSEPSSVAIFIPWLFPYGRETPFARHVYLQDWKGTLKQLI